MQNDRIITITVGTSRKAVVWKPENKLLSEFWTALGNVHRSPETLREYLALPKSKQDELKDVGGFVAGTFKGEKRILEVMMVKNEENMRNSMYFWYVLKSIGKNTKRTKMPIMST